MKNHRLYGKAPYTVAVIHGGPGAAGEMAPVAEELSKTSGVVEPLIYGTSISAQVSELNNTIKANALPPVTLVGYSWGAWIGIIFAARYPGLVGKLVLVSCGPLEEIYAGNIMSTRLRRLNAREQREARALLKTIESAGPGNNKALKRFGSLMSKADSYKPLKISGLPLNASRDVYRKVWKEGASLRRSGGLLKTAAKLRCPVTVIHGSYDPHPFEGLRKPLSRVNKDVKYFRITRCGHTPWLEKYAKTRFYGILEREIGSTE